MNRYPAPELKDLPEDIKARVLEVQEKAGFVPNVFLALARRPPQGQSTAPLHGASDRRIHFTHPPHRHGNFQPVVA